MPDVPRGRDVASVLVTVSRVSAEPQNTDVHIVVVNASTQDVRNIDVRCDARDAQGLQVAQASTRLADIAPSDVVFGQVLFPSEITSGDAKFACVAQQPSNLLGVTR